MSSRPWATSSSNVIGRRTPGFEPGLQAAQRELPRGPERRDLEDLRRVVALDWPQRRLAVSSSAVSTTRRAFAGVRCISALRSS